MKNINMTKKLESTDKIKNVLRELKEAMRWHQCYIEDENGEDIGELPSEDTLVIMHYENAFDSNDIGYCVGWFDFDELEWMTLDENYNNGKNVYDVIEWKEF